MENANRTLQYQRAVTPTIDGGPNSIQSTLVRGKVLSYTSSVRTRYNQPNLNNIDKNSAISSSSAISGRSSAISPRPSATVSTVLQQPDINVQGKSTSLRSVGVTRTSASFRGSIPDQQSVVDPLSSLSMVQRHDLVPFTDDIPPDGIIFARIRNQMDSLVVFRTAEERQRNPERLNLDRRQLEVCPLLEQEQRLRLLNFQNNSIRAISNLENLPNLIFLDLYNNKISSLDGPLSSVRGLRVLMAGKNKISTVSNLSALRKLDVLDLHSNEIRVIEGLDGLADLRVLNLAGNRISTVSNLSTLHSLTELNLRRNCIETVTGLDRLPALQRVFLSHNLIRAAEDMACLFAVSHLVELSLDGNPFSETDPVAYRSRVVLGMSGLRHLDLRRVTDEERANYGAAASSAVVTPMSANGAPGRSQQAHSSDSRAPPSLESPSEPPLHSASSDSDRGLRRRSGSAQAVVLNGAACTPLGSPSPRAEDAFPAVEGRAPTRLAGLSETASIDGRDTATAGRESDTGAAVSTANTFQSSGSLVALARSGRLSAAQNVFELEAIGPDEKALVAVGDAWEWPPASRRLLLSVTEVSLYHMRRETIASRFTPAHLSSLSGLRLLRLVGNDFQSLSQVGLVSALFGRTVEHLVLRDCPLSSSAPALLRGHLVAGMPSLRTFNDATVSADERRNAELLYRPAAELQQLSSPHFVHRSGFPSPSPRHQPSTASELGDATALLRHRKASNNTASGSLGGNKHTPQLSDMSRQALLHRQMSADFDLAFEVAVKQIIRDTLETLHQHP